MDQLDLSKPTDELLVSESLVEGSFFQGQKGHEADKHHVRKASVTCSCSEADIVDQMISSIKSDFGLYQVGCRPLTPGDP